MLARLHGAQFKSSVDDLQDQSTAFDGRRLWLEAELAGSFDFAVPEVLVLRTPDIVASERVLLKARQSDCVSRTEGAQWVQTQAKNERDLLENLLEHAQEYSNVLKELSTPRQNLKASTDQLDRTVLVSQMRGIVNSLSVATIGGAVRPGEEILQIIPLDEELFVEARVKPENIAGVRPGHETTIKLSADGYIIFGALKGKVKLISADTFKNARARDPDGYPHYKVTLQVDTEHLIKRQASVALHTGSKTVLQYLLKPSYQSKEAFREP